MTSPPMRNPDRREFQPVKVPLPLDSHCAGRSPPQESLQPAGVTRPGSFAAVATQSLRGLLGSLQSAPASGLGHSKAIAAGAQPPAKPPAPRQQLLPVAAEAACDPGLSPPSPRLLAPLDFVQPIPYPVHHRLAECAANSAARPRAPVPAP